MAIRKELSEGQAKRPLMCPSATFLVTKFQPAVLYLVQRRTIKKKKKKDKTCFLKMLLPFFLRQITLIRILKRLAFLPLSCAPFFLSAFHPKVFHKTWMYYMAFIKDSQQVLDQ